MNDTAPSSPQGDLRAVFAEIIEGKTVKRSVHELRWGTRDVTLEFVDALTEAGYLPATVAQVSVQPGERVPGFFIEEGTAYFGWVF
ncbi:MAG TPA: hypothetical protein VMF59_01975, partial [Bacteroidota bacterium]|nr:hypothetical protein [Bacteroidota bacterium]